MTTRAGKTLQASRKAGRNPRKRLQASKYGGSARKIDAAMMVAAILLAVAAGLVGVTGFAILVVVVWAAGRLLLDGNVTRPALTGHAAAAAVTGALLTARLLPDTLAVAGPLLAVAVASMLTAPSVRARLSLGFIVAAGSALVWLYATRTVGAGLGAAQVAALALAAVLVWNAWKMVGQFAVLAVHSWRWVGSTVAGLATVVVLIPVLRATAWPVFLAVVVALTGTAYGWDVARARGQARRNAERERWRDAESLGESLFQPLGWTDRTYTAAHKSWLVELEWPADRGRFGAVIVCRRAPGWQATPAQLDTLTRHATTHFGGSWVAEHRPQPRHVLLTRLAEPAVLPTRLAYEYDPAGSLDLIPIGVDGDGQPVIIDLTAETPHVLVSASTGAGKTSLLNLIIAHFAAHGGLIDIVDPAALGFMHLDALPMVRVTDETDDMAAAVVAFRALVKTRTAEAKAARVSIHPGQLRLLIIDEMDTFRRTMTRAGAPGKAALDDLDVVLRKARKLRCHVVVACQQADVKALGDTGSRGQFGFRVATGPCGPEVRTMMFGPGHSDETNGIPAGVLGRIKGRAVVAVGEDRRVCQLAYIGEKAAAQIAAGGLGRHEPAPTYPPAPPSPTGRSGPPPAPAPEPSPGPDVTPPRARARPRAHWGPAGAAVTPDVTPDVTPPQVSTPYSPEVETRFPPAPTPAAPPLELTCKCGHTWTNTKAGDRDRCPSCRTMKRTGRKGSITSRSEVIDQTGRAKVQT